MTREVTLLPSAIDDLKEIFDWTLGGSNPDTAKAYIQRIRDQCEKLRDFPDRGTPRDEIGPGMRTVGFERRATIVYRVEPDKVLIVRILHHGRDIGRAFAD